MSKLMELSQPFRQQLKQGEVEETLRQSAAFARASAVARVNLCRTILQDDKHIKIAFRTHSR